MNEFVETVEVASTRAAESFLWNRMGIPTSQKRRRTLIDATPGSIRDKLKNPFVTTDFSESQIEIITRPFDSVEEVYDSFMLLSDLVSVALPEDEYLWSQSIPCILPNPEDIPISQYS